MIALRHHAAALLFAAASFADAASPEYKIADRIKVSDGSFDYGTYDPGNDRVFMPGREFTTDRHEVQ